MPARHLGPLIVRFLRTRFLLIPKVLAYFHLAGTRHESGSTRKSDLSVCRLDSASSGALIFSSPSNRRSGQRFQNSDSPYIRSIRLAKVGSRLDDDSIRFLRKPSHALSSFGSHRHTLPSAIAGSINSAEPVWTMRRSSCVVRRLYCHGIQRGELSPAVIRTL
jgi:hypothetical protein